MTVQPTRRAALTALAIAGAAPTFARAQPKGGPVTLLNVSYDPTRELYKAYNAQFAADWKRDHGQDVTIEQSHGGSAKQALSVLNGLQADVVTLGIESDIDVLAQKGHLLSPDWRRRLPSASTPYTSTVVFLVRKGNPKGVRDWADLVKPGVQVITPNPKTSSGGRWNYVAAYAWALRRPGGNEAAARDYLRRLYAAVPVLDTGARGSTTTFAQRGLGDVLLAWENEAYLAQAEIGAGQLEIVNPSVSILAEPPVAVVDAVVRKKGTGAVAEAYLRGLYSHRGQVIIAENHYRPRRPDVLRQYGDRFPKIPLINVRELGGWSKLQPVHFADGGVFDTLSRPR